MLVRTILDKLRQDVRPLQRQADAARDAGYWAEAARLYGEVVRIQPEATAIWVQLGHACKEAGYLEQAGLAYRRALESQMDDPHARHFLTTTAMVDLGDTPGRLSAAGTLPARQPAQDTGAGLYVDFSDLLMYFQDSRRPTGIQRVQIRLWRAMMCRNGGLPVRGCVYSDRAGSWVALDPVGFSTLCNLTDRAGDAGDADWRGALDHVAQQTAPRGPIRFPPGSVLVNLGTSWWMPDYMAQVRAAKIRYGVRYVPLIYDLIPLITRDHVAASLTEAFAAWASSVFMHADIVAVISANTARDVERYARDVKPLSQPPVIMPLDAEFGQAVFPVPAAEQAARLDELGLVGGTFVLFVGTLESRKNQMLAFKGWSSLIAERGSGAVPTLVCVGKQGFGFAALRDYLAAQPDLASKVILLSDVLDADLRALYAGCLFTVYTSTYEGWGLPVTESLCHGKVCLAGDHSSLREAGGRFAVYCDADSVTSFVEQARPLLFQPDLRQRLEAAIVSAFRPRQWTQVLDGLVDALGARLPQLPPPGPPVAPVTLGQRYRFASGGTQRLDRTAAVAEMMRTGAGWHAVEAWGMWSRHPVARLGLVFEPPASDYPSSEKDVVAYLTVRLVSAPTTVTIMAGQTRLASVTLPALGDHLLRAVIPAGIAWAPAVGGRPLVLRIMTQAVVPLVTLNGADSRLAGIGLLDITFCAADDLASRLDVIERSVMIVA